MKRYRIQAVIVTTVLLIYLGCVHYLDSYQVAITRNVFTGELTLNAHGGIYITPPWVKVARIDTRPVRVCITSSTRSFNCKLVQFVPQAFREFVQTQGFHYYWWANRLSFNGGYDEEYRGMRDILRGYAFGTHEYSFIRVLNEYPDT